MKNWNGAKGQTTGRIGLGVCATAVAVAFAVALPQAAYADDVTPPPVPGDIAVPAGNRPFLVGHAVGTQNYVCLPSSTGVAFTLFTPEATLLSDDEDQITTHFFGPNPSEPNTNPAVVATGVIRAAWQHSRDGSTVWGQVKQPRHSSSDPAFVAPNAIPWLLATKVGVQNGPAGGDVLTKTTFIQRLNTSGGVAPSTGCNSSADVGHLAFVPYTADYFFSKGPEEHADRGN